MNDTPFHIQANFLKALYGNSFNWETAAMKFAVGNSTIYLTNIGGRRIYIEDREQIDKSLLWIVFMDGFVLGKDNKYHYEPIPSSRTDKFISNTRFNTKEDALAALIKHEKDNAGNIPELIIHKSHFKNHKS